MGPITQKKELYFEIMILFHEKKKRHLGIWQEDLTESLDMSFTRLN